MNREQSGPLLVHVDASLAEIVPSYLENRRKDLTLLADMLQKGDFEPMRVLGHRMKGSGGGYGFVHISDIGRRMEQAALQTNTTELLACIAELTAYLDQIEVVYTETALS
ncbi:MAG: Hpt domain-containing protein [Magnetococcus sp. YQC-3]